MKVILSFATLINSDFSFSEKINFLSQFDVDGIELFGQELLANELNDKDIKKLNKFNHNSIHMPNRGIYDSSNECKDWVFSIIEKAKLFNVENLLFHSHQIQDYAYIFHSGFVSAIENAPDGKRKIGLQTVNENLKILSDHPGLKLVLDPTHALVNSIMPKDFLKLKNYIIGIQLSGIGNIGGDSTDHLSLLDTPKDILQTIRPLLDLDTVFTIETVFSKVDNNIINKEIAFVRNKFFM